MKEISVQDFKEVLAQDSANAAVDFINVCTPSEYVEKHIPGVRSVPLDVLRDHLNEFATKSTIYVHCQSGHRGGRAVEDLMRLGVQAELVNVTGGLSAWVAAGFPTESFTKRLPLMRQTLLSAGFLVALGVLLSLFVHPAFVYLSLFIGCGLMFAGFTGWCGMSLLLEKMPWNKLQNKTLA